MKPFRFSWPSSRVLFLIFCWLSLPILFLVFSIHTWYGPDIWYHLSLGRGILQQHKVQPYDNLILQQYNFSNVYWVFQLSCYSLFKMFGVGGVTALFTVVWGAILAVGIRLLKVGNCHHLGVILMFIALLIFQGRMEERPEVFSYLFVILYLYWLSRLSEDNKLTRLKLLGWTVCQVLWVNIHSYFFIGPAIVLLWLVLAPFEVKAKEHPDIFRSGWILLCLLIVATFVTPFGFGGWGTAIEYAKYAGAMRYQIDEFAPISLQSISEIEVIILLVWDAVVLAVAGIMLVREKKFFHSALAIVGIALSVFAIRNAPLTVILSLPLLGAYLATYGKSLVARKEVAFTFAVVAGAISLLCIVYSVNVVKTGSYKPYMTYTDFGTSLSRRNYAFGPLEYLRSTGFRGNIFNHPSDGSFLEFQLPSVRLYSDSRFIDVAKTTEYFAALDDPEKFMKLHHRTRIDAILVNAKEGQRDLLKLLSASNIWDIVYVDPYRCLIVNRLTPEGRKAPFGKIAINEGQDFTQPENASLVRFWVDLFSYFDKKEYMLTALKQLTTANNLPPSVIRIAMDYANTKNDPEIRAVAKELSTKIMNHPPIP